jgi:competence protein ComEC
LRGVLVALAIGDQDAIAPDDWDVFWLPAWPPHEHFGLHITMLARLRRRRLLRLPHAGAGTWLPARKAAVVAGVLAAFTP